MRIYHGVLLRRCNMLLFYLLSTIIAVCDTLWFMVTMVCLLFWLLLVPKI